MKRGSITVFLALVLVLVMSFIFSLLEGARVSCLKSRARTVTQLCMQSVFGNYHAGLWEDYHLLFLDGCWQEGDFSMEKFAQRAMCEVQTDGNYMIAEGWDLTRLMVRNVEIDSYELATDQDGSVFQSQVSLQMQMEAAAGVLEELIRIKEQGEDVGEREGQSETLWQQAWNAIEQAEEMQEEAQEEAQAGEKQEEVQTGETVENPMDYVKEIKRSSVLGMVLEDPSGLSGKAVEGSFLSERQLLTGNWDPKTNVDGSDRLWLQYYIQNYFSNYAAVSEKGSAEKALDYEMEYLIGGKKSDSENLEKVVYELLGVREAMNFATILQDAEKKSLALGIATAAVGATGLMPLVKAVQIGVLLAWAFVESVLDVRALLAGKRIPFLKKADQWASDLTDCRKNIEDKSGCAGNEEGLTYSQYLQMLLFLLSEKTINYRCMDVIEQNEGIRMDAMVQSVEGTYTYEAQPLFWSLNYLAKKGWDSFSMSVPVTFSYGRTSKG